jgi:transposase
MQDRDGKRRKFNKEFKEEAVRLIMESDRTLVSVARSLGIHENLLYKWKRQYEEDPEGSFPGKGRLKPQEEDVMRLQKENAELRMEREILKKALAIFSIHPK